MLRFACPSCSAVFSAAEEKAGKTSTCPKCKTQFIIPTPEPVVAVAPPPPPPKPKPAPVEAEVPIKPCPGCQATLTVSSVYLGQSVSCPYCQTVFVAEVPGATAPKVAKVAAVLTSPPVVKKPKPAVALDDDDDDDRPKKRKRRDEDDDDDDDDDRPVKKTKSKRRDDDSDLDDDDDDDDRPRKKKGKKKALASKRGKSDSAATMMIIAGILSILIGGAICYFAYEDSSVFNVKTSGMKTDGMPAEVKSLVNKVLMFIWCIRFYDLAAFVAGPTLVIAGIGLLLKQQFGKIAGLVGAGASGLALLFGILGFLILLTADTGKNNPFKDLDIDTKFIIRVVCFLAITAFNFIVLTNSRHTSELK